MAVVVDHQPSVVENVFPVEIVAGLYDSHDRLSQEDLRKFLGEKRFKSFKEILNKNVLISASMRAPSGPLEFVDPVVPLYYYRNLEEIQSKQNKEALKLHGSSHGVIEGFLHPECRLLWKRIMEISEDTLLHDNPTENAISIRNNNILITSFLPIEEIRATYLRDWSIADQNRKKELQEFENRDVKELFEENRWRAIMEWPYIVASKSVGLLRKVDFNENEISDVIRKCDLVASEFELQESQDWVSKEDKLISNLPYLISVLRNSEKIKSGEKTIDEVLPKPENVKCFRISPYFHASKLELEKWTRLEKQGQRIWKAWKFKNVVDAIMEGELARASLFYIADYIVASLILVEGGTRWRYEVLIPKIAEYGIEIPKIVAKIKLLLLTVNPTFGYDIEPGKGEEIKAFDSKFVFPRIKPRKDAVGKIKELFEEEDDFCKEIEKELENYGKRIELERKIESIINTSPNLF